MTHDADSTLQYLTTSRAIPAQQIIPYGTGVGASLAIKLAADHTTIPALILDAPRGDLLEAARRDPRSHLIPVSLLFHEHFPLAAPLATLKTPKLLLSRNASPNQSFLHASDPKLTVELPSLSETLYTQSLTRFLDQYLPAVPIQQIVSSPTPTR